MRASVAASIVAAVALADVVPASVTHGALPEPPPGPIGAAVPGASLPIVNARRYTMSGAVRPLLFWIGRDDIGLARITWRARPNGGAAYELLVGTDPARAPRGLNRWGYIAEETDGAGGSVLALMTGSSDTSYDAEAAAVSHVNYAGDFRAIRSRLAGGTATWQLARVRTPDAFTVHQLADVLDYASHDGAEGARRARPIVGEVRSGFLVAVAELLDDVLRSGSDPRAPHAPRMRYVFGAQTYELRIRRADQTTVASSRGQTPAMRVTFEARTVQTGETTAFELTAATTGELAGVPLLIEWQPRWWLKVSLRLADDPVVGSGASR